MLATTHLFSGDSAADSYRSGGGDGDVLVWREALAAGPTPAGDDFLDQRARFLAGDRGESEATCRQNLADQERALGEALGRAGRVVLWFARDLWCEIQLCYILSELVGRAGRVAEVDLVCPPDSGTPQFPCFGVLDPADLVALAPTAQAVSGTDLADARAAWQAISSDDPTELDRCLGRLGFDVARDAVSKQRERFPSASGGLGVTEQVALELIGAGATTLGDLMAGFSARLPDYCWPDSLIATELDGVMTGPEPLVGASSVQRGPDRTLYTGLRLTPAGRDVLAGTRDRIGACGIDTWIGGAHLITGQVWRFDQTAQRIVAG